MSPDRQALDARVELLEVRVAELERVGAGAPAAVPAGDFWALAALKARLDEPGGVLFTGTVTLPTGEHYEWQEGRRLEALLADDWSQDVASLSALAHPVRLLLLHEVLHGSDTVSELATHERLGTTGQLYHHLRQLVAAGWLRTTARGRYAVPGERVVPLLTLLTAARR